MKLHERKKTEAVEMDCLSNICSRRRIDRVPNVRIRRRCGNDVSVGQRIDQGLLRWFGHVERMGDEMLAERVNDSNVRNEMERKSEKLLDKFSERDFGQKESKY